MVVSVVDPVTREPLTVAPDGLRDQSGSLRFPLVGGAFRLVSSEGYAANFGFQWNRFARTQIDKFNGMDLSRARLQAETAWRFDEMEGQTVLEVGSGAGRFTQVLLDSTKAEVFSVDYSDAVAANFLNNGPHPRLKLFQASIYELPFAPGQFDKVICLGVLQHTPDVARSIACLATMLKPNGELVVDFYPLRGWWTKISAKYLLRPIAKKLPSERLHALIEKNVDWLIRLYKFNRAAGFGWLNRFVPIPDIGKYSLPENLSDSDLRELCVLDTFDMFSPEYDQPQRVETVRQRVIDAGLSCEFSGYVRYRTSSAAVVRGRAGAEGPRRGA